MVRDLAHEPAPSFLGKCDLTSARDRSSRGARDVFAATLGELHDVSWSDGEGGGEIVGYLKTGSAYYAPAAAAVQMAEAIVKDKRRILPCAAWLEGEFGMSGIYLGVPCLLGENGLEQIIEVALDNDERAALETSARHVRSTVEALEALQ